MNDRIVSIFGEFDPHIPEGSALPGATNITLPTGGHFRILSDPATLKFVLEAVSRPARAASPTAFARPAQLKPALAEVRRVIETRYARIRR